MVRVSAWLVPRTGFGKSMARSRYSRNQPMPTGCGWYRAPRALWAGRGGRAPCSTRRSALPFASRPFVGITHTSASVDVYPGPRAFAPRDLITSCLTTPPPRSPSPVRPPCPTTHHRLAGPSDHPRLQVPVRRAPCMLATWHHLLIDRCRRWERQRVSKRL